MRKILFFCALFIMTSYSVAQQTGKMIKSADLLSEASLNSSKVVSVKSGQTVVILEKKGFWIKVQSDNKSGWTKLSDVELPSNDIKKIDPMSTGRASSGNIVNTAGVRGLSPDELKNAKPNSSAVDQATKISQSIAIADITSFASSGGIVARANLPEVKAVKISNTGNVQIQQNSSNANNPSNNSPTINLKPTKKDSNEW